jgi:hypothetical protein
VDVHELLAPLHAAVRADARAERAATGAGAAARGASGQAGRREVREEPKEDEMKKWYQSKTLWLNIITAGIAVVTLAAGTPGILPEVAVKYALFGVAAANIVIRIFFTETPIEPAIK